MNHRLLVYILLISSCSLLPVGCGPSDSEEELGNILFEMPNIPGADEAVEMPELEPADAEPSENDPPKDGPKEKVKPTDRSPA